MADTARIEELRRRVQMDPASIAFAALAEEYRRARRFDDAIATCRTGLQRHPAYLSARVTLGRSLVEIGHYDEARQELELVLRAAPENLAAIRALAEIHRRAGEIHEGEDHLVALGTQAVPDVSPVAPPDLAPVSGAARATRTEPPAVGAASPASASPAVSIASQTTVRSAPQVTAPIPPRAAAAVLSVDAPPSKKPADPIPAQVAAPMARHTGAPVATLPAPSARPPAPMSRQPHPDEMALPALEVFLSAIVAARTSANRISS